MEFDYLSKTFVQEKIEEIAQILELEYKKTNSIGLLGGTSGIALFFAYYDDFLMKDGSRYERTNKIIQHSIDLINSGQLSPTFCDGISGFGWMLDHLYKTGLSEHNYDQLLMNFDSFLYKRMIKDLENGYFDYLHGGLGYGMYFLQRLQCTQSKTLREKYFNYLLDLIDLLKVISVKIDENKCLWTSTISLENRTLCYNFGLAHGIPSIIIFLSKLSQNPIFHEKTKELLLHSSNYLLSVYNERNGHSSFPSWIIPGENKFVKSRLGWCYGDLGVAIALMEASKVLRFENGKTLKKISLKVFNKCLKRTITKDTQVIDAGICHGSFGIALIYRELQVKLNLKHFGQGANYWLVDGLKRSNMEDGFAGFKQWKGEKGWSNEVGLLDGISGIGLSLISSLNHNKESSSWSKCLLIDF